MSGRFVFEGFKICNDDPEQSRTFDVYVNVFNGIVISVEIMYPRTVLPAGPIYTETQFLTLFPGGQDIINNALESYPN